MTAHSLKHPFTEFSLDYQGATNHPVKSIGERLLTSLKEVLEPHLTAIFGRSDNTYFKPKPANNVLDYYLKLPKNYFDIFDESSDVRLKYIKIEDLRHGYLKISKPYQLFFSVDPAEFEIESQINGEDKLLAQIEIALFRHDAGRNILAVFYRYNDDCSACPEPMIDFWEDHDGELINVTKRIKAQINSEIAYAEFEQQGRPSGAETIEDLKRNFGYELPRFSRTIKIVIDRKQTDKRVELLNFRWTGKQFVSEPIN